MRTRHAPALALLLALSACGASDSKSGDDTAANAPTDPSSDSASLPNSCHLLSDTDVGKAVGAPVKQVQHKVSGYVTTGGSSDLCTWLATDQDHVSDQATLILYSDAAACDSVKTKDARAISGIGDSAFVGDVASVYVYLGRRCFMAQWYSLDASDKENLPLSTALAKAASARL